MENANNERDKNKEVENKKSTNHEGENKKSTNHETFPKLEEEEMSLSSKMELFYLKSQKSFGVKDKVDLFVQVQFGERQDNEEANYSVDGNSISSSKEDVSGTDYSGRGSTIERTVPSEDHSSGGPSSFNPSRRVSVEVSLPNSNQEHQTSRDDNQTPLPEQVEEADSDESMSASSEETVATVSDRNEPLDEVFEDVLDAKRELEEDETSSYSSLSSPRNLQEEIDERIEQSQTTGHLDFAIMGLPFFPSAVLCADVSMITRLSLQDNQLSSLPGSALNHLQSLTWFDLRFNKLTLIPPEIGKLKQLQVLLLQGNYLDRLPLELGKLSELKTLQFNDNPIKYPPSSITKGGLEVIMKFLNSTIRRKRKRIHSYRSIGSEASLKCRKGTNSRHSSHSIEQSNIKTFIETNDQDDQSFSTDISKSPNCTNCSEITVDSSKAIAESGGLTDKTEDDTTCITSNTRHSKGPRIREPCESDCVCTCSDPITDPRRGSEGTSVSELEDLLEDDEEDDEIETTEERIDELMEMSNFGQRPRRLCQQVKNNSLEIPERRRKSLHLVLHNAGLGTSDLVQVKKCLRCKRYITINPEQDEMPVEIVPVPMTEMSMPELQDTATRLTRKPVRKKKILNGRSSKVSKSRLITAKKVEQRSITAKKLEEQTRKAANELQNLQTLRSHFALQSWREDTKRIQDEFAKNFSESNYVPPVSHAPFAIDESTLRPSRSKLQTPTFTRLNERQRKLSTIETEIKDCLRKLGNQEANRRASTGATTSGGSSQEGAITPHSYQRGRLSLRETPMTVDETGAVLKQLHNLRRQIQRLKLNTFI